MTTDAERTGEQRPGRRRYSQRRPREQRAAELLDASLKLVAREGWPALRVDRVARSAGIAKSVLYATFGSLETLQHATLQREQERLFRTSVAALTAARSTPDPAAATARALAVFLEAVDRDRDSWRLVLMPPIGTPPAVERAISEGRERWRREIEELVGTVAGLHGLDAELIAHLVRGTAEYLARLLLEDPDRFPRARLEQFAGEALGRLRGLR